MRGWRPLGCLVSETGDMRVAAGILGILLSLGCLFQSCAVLTASSMSAGLASMAAKSKSDASTPRDSAAMGTPINGKVAGLQAGGALGVLSALGLLIGGAFSFGMPRIATAGFATAAALAFLGFAQSDFGDLGFWGLVATVLAGMSYSQQEARTVRPLREPNAAESTRSALTGAASGILHPSAEARLRELQRLHDAGLVSDGEFARKQSEILDDV